MSREGIKYILAVLKFNLLMKCFSGVQSSEIFNASVFRDVMELKLI